MKKTKHGMKNVFIGSMLLASGSVWGQTQAPIDGSVLPFPEPPTASVAAQTLQESTMIRRKIQDHLSANPPNIVIILLDDVGFGASKSFGGAINTPTLQRCMDEGITYNSFETTSISSPTRAALLTGRNHTRVGSGTIAERAVDFDGYTGIIPKTSATIAEVLKDYGYNTAAFGKWHNTPANQTTTMGPHDYWPNNYGFEYFYGFMAGETSQYEPRLWLNYQPVEPPHEKGYYLTRDLTNHTLAWIAEHKAFNADKPFFVYYAPGAVHGPQQVAKEWADKYKGQFDDGWDAYRVRTYQRQLKLGVIPANTILTPRDSTMIGWDQIPLSERKFQSRLMEIFAGFLEQTDYEVGRLLDGIDKMGYKDNTLVFYIFGDNGSSAEGQNGSISELLAQNEIPNTVAQQIKALDRIGGLEALGGPKTDNMYNAGWAWAGDTPFRSTKLVAAHFGGTRNPLVVVWPDGIKHDSKMRSQFHHINDIVPTIYDILGITPPKEVNGFEQDPFDGVSMKYTFGNPDALDQKQVQFFDNNGSRGIYHDGWFADTFGPLYPWIPAQKGLAKWNSNNDVWQLYDLRTDFSQATDLSAKYPEKLQAMKDLFLKVAKDNKDFPIGAGIWLRLHPQDAIKSTHTHWVFDQNTRRMPELSAPGIGKVSSQIDIDIDVPKNANGVLYALGGAGGGLTCYMLNNSIVYEYNMMIIEQYDVTSNKKIAPGKHHFTITTKIANNKPGGEAFVTIDVDGNEVAKTTVKRTVPLAFTASETFDVGADLGSPVSMNYFDKAPFAFNGKIEKMEVKLLTGDDTK